MKAVVFICFTLLPFVLCDEPVISQISSEQIKAIGESVQFNCSVQNIKNYPVLWMKFNKYRQDGVPVTTNNALILVDPRFSVKVDTNTSTYSLGIKELQESDTGFYQCQILIDATRKLTAEVELQIRRPPTISHNTTRSINVTEGKPFKLYCNADGFPVPTISWKRENDVLLSTGGAIYRGIELIIPSAHRDDRGIYYCEAENGVGAKATSNTTVRVEFAPVITAVRPRVGQASSYNVNLECKIEAYPAPEISWYKKGEELKKEQSKSQDVEFIDTLQRYSIGSSDYGEYICRAKNIHGVAETKVELFETVIPVCANACG